MLALAGARCPPFMFGQLCVALGVAFADDDGVAAGLADPALTAVVLVPDDDVVAEVACVVEALATARLPPNPTPSAPAPIAVPIITLLSRVFNVPASLRSGDGPRLMTPALAADFLRQYSTDDMKPAATSMKWGGVDTEGEAGPRRG